MQPGPLALLTVLKELPQACNSCHFQPLLFPVCEFIHLHVLQVSVDPQSFLFFHFPGTDEKFL